MRLVRHLLTLLGVFSFAGAGQVATPSQREQCQAFCRSCDTCFAGDPVARASCRFLRGQVDDGPDACEAECAQGQTPASVSRGALGENWSRLTCEQLASAL